MHNALFLINNRFNGTVIGNTVHMRGKKQRLTICRAAQHCPYIAGIAADFGTGVFFRNLQPQRFQFGFKYIGNLPFITRVYRNLHQLQKFLQHLFVFHTAPPTDIYFSLKPKFLRASSLKK